MTGGQLDILDAITAIVDPDKVAILELIGGDPKHARARDAVVEAIRSSVQPDGTVSSNHWRGRVPSWVFSRIVGATVNRLRSTGVLVPTGDWLISDDRHGRNSGRPVRVYRWTGNPT